VPGLDVILGPVGVAAGAIGVVVFLARILREYIEELKTERNIWRERALASDVRTDRLADAIETAIKVRVP
jgi:hypothetical protein